MVSFSVIESQGGKLLGDSVFPPFTNLVLSIRLKPSGTLSVKKNQEEPVQHQLEVRTFGGQLKCVYKI